MRWAFWWFAYGLIRIFVNTWFRKIFRPENNLRIFKTTISFGYDSNLNLVRRFYHIFDTFVIASNKIWTNLWLFQSFKCITRHHRRETLKRYIFFLRECNTKTDNENRVEILTRFNFLLLLFYRPITASHTANPGWVGK